MRDEVETKCISTLRIYTTVGKFRKKIKRKVFQKALRLYINKL